MTPLDDPFYAGLLTLSDAELCIYLQQYAHYKVEAVHAALAELRMRGVYVSEATVAEIDRYFTCHKQQQPVPSCATPPAMALIRHFYHRPRLGRVSLRDRCCSPSLSARV